MRRMIMKVTTMVTLSLAVVEFMDNANKDNDNNDTDDDNENSKG